MKNLHLTARHALCIYVKGFMQDMVKNQKKEKYQLVAHKVHRE